MTMGQVITPPGPAVFDPADVAKHEPLLGPQTAAELDINRVREGYGISPAAPLSISEGLAESEAQARTPQDLEAWYRYQQRRGTYAPKAPVNIPQELKPLPDVFNPYMGGLPDVPIEPYASGVQGIIQGTQQIGKGLTATRNVGGMPIPLETGKPQPLPEGDIGDVLGGASKIIRGAGSIAAPAAITTGLLTNPLGTFLSTAEFFLAQQGIERGAKALGAKPDVAAFLGDVGGLMLPATGVSGRALKAYLGWRAKTAAHIEQYWEQVGTTRERAAAGGALAQKLFPGPMPVTLTNYGATADVAAVPTNAYVEWVRVGTDPKTAGRPYLEVLEEGTHKRLFEGWGEDVGKWLRKNGAQPRAGQGGGLPEHAPGAILPEQLQQANVFPEWDKLPANQKNAMMWKLFQDSQSGRLPPDVVSLNDLQILTVEPRTLRDPRRRRRLMERQVEIAKKLQLWQNAQAAGVDPFAGFQEEVEGSPTKGATAAQPLTQYSLLPEADGSYTIRNKLTGEDLFTGSLQEAQAHLTEATGAEQPQGPTAESLGLVTGRKSPEILERQKDGSYVVKDRRTYQQLFRGSIQEANAFIAQRAQAAPQAAPQAAAQPQAPEAKGATTEAEPVQPELSKTHTVSPETPNPPTAGVPTVEESPATIAKQVAQLKSRVRSLVMFPQGTQLPPISSIPAGMTQFSDDFGNIYWGRGDMMERGAVRSAARNNTLPELLGAAEINPATGKQFGLGAPDKSLLKGKLYAVVGRDTDGVEIQSTATDEEHLQQTITAMNKLAPHVAVEPAGGVLAERQGEQAPPAAPAAPLQSSPEERATRHIADAGEHITAGDLEEAAISLWKARHAGATSLPGERLRALEAELERNGITTFDFKDGAPYDHGMTTVEPIAFQPIPGATRRTIAETYAPGVTKNGKVIRKAKIIVATPEAAETEELGQPQEIAASEEKQVTASKPLNVDIKFPLAPEAAAALHAAAFDPVITRLARNAGISRVRIDEPRTFELSQEGGVTHDGVIRLNPNATDLRDTFLHELGEVLWERSDEGQRKQLAAIAQRTLDILRQTSPGYAQQFDAGNPHEAVAQTFSLWDQLPQESRDALSSFVPSRSFEETFPEPAKPTTQAVTTATKNVRSWEDIREGYGSIYATDDLAAIVKAHGDRDVVIKDVNGGRHRMPASLAAEALADPVISGHVGSVFTNGDPASQPVFDGHTLNYLPNLKKAFERLMQRYAKAKEELGAPQEIKAAEQKEIAAPEEPEGFPQRSDFTDPAEYFNAVARWHYEHEQTREVPIDQALREYSGADKVPSFDPPQGLSDEEYDTWLAREGLRGRNLPAISTPPQEIQWVHGTTPEAAEAIKSQGFRVADADVKRQYSYSQFGPDAIYFAPEGSWWLDKDRAAAGRAIGYDAMVPATLSPDARILTIKTAHDWEAFAKHLGISGEDLEWRWNVELDSPDEVKRAQEITNAFRALGYDGLFIASHAIEDVPSQKRSVTVAGPQLVIFNPKVVAPTAAETKDLGKPKEITAAPEEKPEEEPERKAPAVRPPHLDEMSLLDIEKVAPEFRQAEYQRRLQEARSDEERAQISADNSDAGDWMNYGAAGSYPVLMNHVYSSLSKMLRGEPLNDPERQAIEKYMGEANPTPQQLVDALRETLQMEAGAIGEDAARALHKLYMGGTELTAEELSALEGLAGGKLQPKAKQPLPKVKKPKAVKELGQPQEITAEPEKEPEKAPLAPGTRVTWTDPVHGQVTGTLEKITEGGKTALVRIEEAASPSVAIGGVAGVNPELLTPVEPPQTKLTTPKAIGEETIEPDVTRGAEGETGGGGVGLRTEGARPLGGVPTEDVPGTPEAGLPVSGGVGGGGEHAGTHVGTPTREGEEAPVRPGAGDSVPGVVSPPGRGRPTKPDVRSNPTPTGLGGDYRLTPEQAAEIELAGAKTKARANLEAIRVIKQIIHEGNRAPTLEEQQKLARYTGWGDSALAQGIFLNRPEWKGIRQDLEDLLTPEEYDAAEHSTQNAHYTRRDIAAAMWDAAIRLGFRAGGSITEMGGGIGNFFMMMPESLIPGTSRTLVELDPITAAIARALFPGSLVINKALQETNLPDNYFDLNIGNYPFAKHGVSDPVFRREPYLTQNLHNYFFAKSLLKVRPGGLMLVITSRYTMDSQNTAFRRWMNDRAELLGAIRLPTDTFKANAGTSVTTDLLVLRKRIPGGIPVADEKWVEAPKYTMESGGQINLNEYFHRRPEMMMGKMGPGKMQARDSADLIGEFSMEHLKALFNALPADVMTAWSAGHTGASDALVENYPDAAHIKDHQYGIVNGAVVKREGGYFRPVTLPPKKLERMKGLIALRGVAREVIRSQELRLPEPEILAARAALNKGYKSFVREYGPVNLTGNAQVFGDDPDWPVLAGLLEEYDRRAYLDTPKAAKAKQDWDVTDKGDVVLKHGTASYTIAKTRPIFRERTHEKPPRIEHVETAAEALAVSLNEVARIDWDRMQELTGRDPETLQRELAGKLFHNPISKKWETDDEYLSGNVRQKLKDAEFATNTNERYAENVEALKLVQPPWKEPGIIKVSLGATWVPDTDYAAFAEEILKVEQPPGERREQLVRFVPQTGGFAVRESRTFTDAGVANTTDYGTPYFDGLTSFEMALNFQAPVARDTFTDIDGTERSVKNPDATIAAVEKQSKLVDAFVNWIWSEPERAQRLATKYNEEINNIKLREHDGSHLTFPGLNKSWMRSKEPEPHQKNAVWRTLLSGNTLYAHVVGAGKTLEIIMACMELRRLGMRKKPIVTVPNHLVGQWSDAFLQAYPAAQILVPVKKDFQKENRQKLMARIASGNYDAVIVGHKSFELIPVKEATYKAFIDSQLQEIDDALDVAREGLSAQDEHRNPTIKQLRRRRAQLQAKLDKRLKKEKKDTGLTFEELGVDQIFVDEADLFKNLGYNTMMDRIAGLPNTDSDRATDMHLKTQFVSNLHGGDRGVVFATGTPVSNSIAEIWTMMRYLMPNYLEREGFHTFDAWAKTFGKTRTQMEVAPEGGRFIQRTRFSKFQNAAQMMNMFRLVADIRTAKQLNLPTPAIWKGGYVDVIAKASPALKGFVEHIGDRADAVRNGQVRPEDDNMLKISSDGRKASLDMRLVQPTELVKVPENEQGIKGNRWGLKNFTHVEWQDEDGETRQGWVLGAATTDAADVFKDYNGDENGIVHLGGVQGEVAPGGDNVRRKDLTAVFKVVPRAEEPGSKVNLAIGNILDAYKEFGEHKGTQLVFLDLSTPKSEKVARKKKKVEEEEVANVDEPEEGAEVYGEKEEAEEEEVETAEEARERFSVYGDIKNKLVAGGIPAEEIAFIQEAKTDAKKAELFARMREGKVRVLLGTTEGMGAGTNVQDRLVALHHLDAPWRPRDMAQRDGRIVRPGNKLWEQFKIPVRLYRYMTEGSFDAFMWETLASKAAPIEQLMEGDPSMDEVDELSPLVLSYEQAKAISSGNPLIREKIILDQDVHKLEVSRGNWLAEQSRIGNELAGMPGQIRFLKQAIHHYESAIETRDANPGLKVGDRTYTDKAMRAEGAPALYELLKALPISGNIQKLDASWRGFPLEAVPDYEVIDARINDNGQLLIREVREVDGKNLSMYFRVTKDDVKGHQSYTREDLGLVPLDKKDAQAAQSVWNKTGLEDKVWKQVGSIRVLTRPTLRMIVNDQTHAISTNYDSPAGTIHSLEYHVQFEDSLKGNQNELRRQEKKLIELETKRGETFTQEERLTELRRRQAELAEQLNTDGDDQAALRAKDEGEEGEKSDQQIMLADPASAMHAKWFKSTRYYVGTGRARKSQKGYQVTKNLAVHQEKKEWIVDHPATGTSLAKFSSDVAAVAFARQAENALDFNYTAPPHDISARVSNFRSTQFQIPKETPEESKARLFPKEEAPAAERAPAQEEESKAAIEKYKPGRPLKPDDYDWATGKIGGEPYYSNSHFAVLGEAPPDFPESFNKFQDAASDKVWSPTGNEKPVVPVAWSKEKDVRSIWFSDGTPIDSEYYDYLKKLHPDATFEHEEKEGKAVRLIEGGKTVGLIMPRRDTMPDDVKSVVESPKTKSLLRRIIEEESGEFNPEAIKSAFVQLYKQDIAPKAKEVSQRAQGVWDNVQVALAPQTRGEPAKKGAGMLREMGSEIDQRRDRAVAALMEFRDHFYKDTHKELGVYGLSVYDAIERGDLTGLSPKDRDFANAARKLLDSRYDEVEALGLLKSYIENYLPHEYKKPDEASRWIQNWQSKRPLAGSEAYRRQRKYPTLREALEDPEFTLKPKFDNPVDFVLSKLGQMDKSILAHTLYDELETEGRLAYVRATGGKLKPGYAYIDDKIFTVFGPRKGAVKFDIPAPDRSHFADDEEYENALIAWEERMETIDQVVSPSDVRVFGRRVMGRYSAPESLATVINHHLSPGISFTDAYKLWRDVNNTLNLVDLSASLYHGLTTTLNSSFSDMALGMKQALAGHVITGAASVGRGFVPFASVVDDWFEGNYLQKVWDGKIANPDPMAIAIVDALKKGGGRARQDLYYATNLWKGMMDSLARREDSPIGAVWGAVWRAPLAAIELPVKAIMERLVPHVKLGAFAKRAQLEIEQNPTMSLDEARERFGQIWDNIDDRFGQLTQRNLMMHPLVKDLMNAAVGRPGWNIGTVRAIGGGFYDALKMLGDGARGRKPKFTDRTAYLLALLLGGAIINGAVSWLLSGEPPTELMDFIMPRDGGFTEDGRPSRIVLPTYIAKDIYSYFTHPKATLKAKAAPVITIISDLATNKDWQGQKIYGRGGAGTGRYLLSAVTPYAIQGLQKNIERGASPWKTALPFLGIMPAGRRAGMTKAEKILTDYQDENRPAVRRVSTEHSRARADIYRAVRAGDQKKTQQLASEAVRKGTMTPPDVGQALQRAREGPLENGLQDSRLPVSVALEIYDAATPAERKAIEHTLRTKIQNALPKPYEWDDESRKLVQQYFGVRVPRSDLASPTAIQ